MKQAPTNLDYLRAHQYLYYILARPVLTDYEYDMFGRDSGEDYKGGSDRTEDYSLNDKALALAILDRSHPLLPKP